jgi:hypothetical protein
MEMMVVDIISPNSVGHSFLKSYHDVECFKRSNYKVYVLLHHQNNVFYARRFSSEGYQSI